MITHGFNLCGLLNERTFDCWCDTYNTLVMETKGIIKTGAIIFNKRQTLHRNPAELWLVWLSGPSDNLWNKSSLPTRWTHHLVASSDHACSPAPTSSGVWSRDLEPKGLSLCTALPYHQLLLKRQEKRDTQIKLQKAKKKTLKKYKAYKLFSFFFFWQFSLLSHFSLLVSGGGGEL